MARVEMRAVLPGEVPPDGGTAIQEEADRPVFSANGPDDYVCASCGNLLAASMSDVQMTLKVRIKCGRCRTVNVAITDIKGQPIRIR